MLTNWRDPVTFMNDFDVFDPFTGTLGDLLPRQRGGMSRRSNLLGLICLNTAEVGGEFKIVAEIPGVPKDCIDVSVDNGLFTIKVNKEVPEWLQNSTMLRNEIVYGTETRSLRIPKGFKDEPSGLHYKDGVLCACFPKSEEHESKKLQIESV